MIKARPYVMRNAIQNYAWGTRGNNAFIPNLLGFTPEENTPYAEVWLGAHPKAPSRIKVDGNWQALDQLGIEYPEEVLGSTVASKYHGLPFLYKILSAGDSLSIQAHPTKEQAEQLHRSDSEHYPDDNHKPEIAVALDHLTALMGFQPLGAMLKTFEMYPELKDFVGKNVVMALQPVLDSQITLQEKRVQRLAQAIIKRAAEESEILGATLDALGARLLNNLERSERQQLFLDLREKYGSQDVGLVFLFLFNIVHLHKGEAIYTPAGVPHAYLKGNILECMANSDNVVRVGLTPKFRDSKTLVEIIDAKPQSPVIMSPEFAGNEVVYMTPATEFELRQWSVDQKNPMSVETNAHPAVVLVTSGKASITWGESESMELRTGESVFIPACLPAYTLISKSECELHWCGVPV